MDLQLLETCLLLETEDWEHFWIKPNGVTVSAKASHKEDAKNYFIKKGTKNYPKHVPKITNEFMYRTKWIQVSVLNLGKSSTNITIAAMVTNEQWETICKLYNKRTMFGVVKKGNDYQEERATNLVGLEKLLKRNHLLECVKRGTFYE